MQDRISKVNQAVQTTGGREGKYLTFSLAGEEYGIGILKIREIIGMMPITSVPQCPGLRQRRHQPPGQGHSGHRSAAAVRHARHGLFGAHLHHRGPDRSAG